MTADVQTTGAAAPARRVLAQARFEVRAVLRNGEQLMVTVLLPLVALLVLAWAPFVGDGAHRLDQVVPRVLAFAVLSTAFTSPAIATAFDRRNGVLRLLATTPLGRTGLLSGKVLAVLAVEAITGTCVSIAGFALGWRPTLAALLLAVVVGLLGTATFVALALLVAGTLRAEAVLAVANLLLLALALGGGVLVPAADLPGPLGQIAGWLPSGALGSALSTALATGTVPTGPLVVLAAWAIGLAALVGRFFRWD